MDDSSSSTRWVPLDVLTGFFQDIVDGKLELKKLPDAKACRRTPWPSRRRSDPRALFWIGRHCASRFPPFAPPRSSIPGSPPSRWRVKKWLKRQKVWSKPSLICQQVWASININKVYVYVDLITLIGWHTKSTLLYVNLLILIGWHTKSPYLLILIGPVPERHQHLGSDYLRFDQEDGFQP